MNLLLCASFSSCGERLLQLQGRARERIEATTILSTLRIQDTCTQGIMTETAKPPPPRYAHNHSPLSISNNAKNKRACMYDLVLSAAVHVLRVLTVRSVRGFHDETNVFAQANLVKSDQRPDIVLPAQLPPTFEFAASCATGPPEFFYITSGISSMRRRPKSKI